MTLRSPRLRDDIASIPFSIPPNQSLTSAFPAQAQSQVSYNVRHRCTTRNTPTACFVTRTDMMGLAARLHLQERLARDTVTVMQIPNRLRPWMVVSAAWIVPAGFGAINRIAQTRLSGWDPVTARDLLWSGGDWFVYAFLTPGVFAISRRWPLARPLLARRASLHLAISLLFCVAWATIGKLLEFGLTLAFDPNAIHAGIEAGHAQFLRKAGVDWLSWVFTTLPFGVAVYLCVVGVEHAIRYFTEARERELQMARLSEQLTGARFAALQAQVNPHFLFNTLNTIAVLVRDDDRRSAVSIIEQLGEVLRSTLSRHRANEVTLGEELELVRRYVAIEQARFSDRLRPEFKIDESLLSAAVPSFALQHLVENALRHGIARRTDSGQIVITARRDGVLLELSVQDDGAGMAPDGPHKTGHGLENTRQRLATLYGEGASLVIEAARPRGTIARLRIPYHEVLAEPDEGAESDSEV
jgi:two-component system LytT family sensor kinase